MCICTCILITANAFGMQIHGTRARVNKNIYRHTHTHINTPAYAHARTPTTHPQTQLRTLEFPLPQRLRIPGGIVLERVGRGNEVVATQIDGEEGISTGQGNAANQ